MSIVVLSEDSLQAAAQKVTPTSSITVTKNTKGYGWEIKIYFDNQVKGARNRAIQQVKEVDKQLRELFEAECDQ